MADLSSGNDEKSVLKSNSFNKFLGRSPARTMSSKKSANPFSKIFSRSKKLDKQNIPDDAENDPSYIPTEADTGMIEETVPTTTTIMGKIEEAATKVIEEMPHHANVENLVQDFQEMTHAKPAEESKESTPVATLKDMVRATDEEKKPEFFNKLIQGAEKAKEELQEKAKEELHKIEGGLKDAYKAIMSKDNAPNEQPNIDDKKAQEKSVNVDEAKVPVPLSTPTPTQALPEEVVPVIGAAMQAKTEATCQGENQEKEIKKEENCVASLAEGLQKICATWNTKKED